METVEAASEPECAPRRLGRKCLVRQAEASPHGGGAVLRSLMLVFRQLFDPTSSTYTYLLGCSAARDAVLIDPVFEQARRDAALINELGLRLLWTLETHVHADHVTGAWLLKQKLGSRIALAAASGAAGATGWRSAFAEGAAGAGSAAAGRCRSP